METKHKPVLLKEVIELLDIQSSDCVFDGTLGSGGHASEIIKLLGENACFIGSDLDPESIKRARSKIEKTQSKAEIFLFHGNFADIKKYLKEAGKKYINKASLDLGWSLDQFKNSGRGFSFNQDEPLDMRYNPESELSAKDLVNFLDEEQLAQIIKDFGEERFARKIAKNIVEYRKNKEISSSLELAEIVSASVPRKAWGKLHPATKTFQALRIVVNQELESLSEALDNILDSLASRGRLAVITFHSIEDRLVKRKFVEWEKENLGKRINKKVITASKEELKDNPSARSAKLRVYEKA